MTTILHNYLCTKVDVDGRDKNLIEKSADFFLAPCRHLFHGREVKIVRGYPQNHQSKSVNGWLRVAFNIVALIPGVLFGSLFRGCSLLLSSSTRKCWKIAIQASVAPNKECLDDVIDACNELSCKIMRRFSGNDKSYFFSAASLLPVMGMLLEGMSNSDVKVAMMEKLDLDYWDEDEVHKAIGYLLRAMEVQDNETGLTLTSANTLISQEDCLPDYIKGIREQYDAEVFADEQQFADKVEKDVEGVAAIIANVVNFQGIWADRFKKTDTAPVVFTSLNGEKTSVQMMSQTTDGAFGDFKREGYTLFGKSYKTPKERDILHLFLLPHSNKNIEDLEQSWGPVDLLLVSRIFDNIQEVKVSVPRINANFSVEDLEKDPLDSYGVETSYDKILPDLRLKSIKQKAGMTMNEDGGAIVSKASLRDDHQPPKEIDFNRPFIHMVVDRSFREKGEEPLILFMGCIKDAKYLEKVV